MNCGLGKSKLLIGTLIVLLFMYAYKIYQKKKKFLEIDDDDDDEKSDVLDKVRSKKNEKKVQFNGSAKDEVDKVDKDKINKLVNEILSRQIPS